MAAHQISSSHAPNQCSFHGNRISGCLAAARSVPTKWQINNVDSITLPQRCLSFLPVRALVWISCAPARQDMSTADQDRATQPKKKKNAKWRCGMEIKQECGFLFHIGKEDTFWLRGAKHISVPAIGRVETENLEVGEDLTCHVSQCVSVKWSVASYIVLHHIWSRILPANWLESVLLKK